MALDGRSDLYSLGVSLYEIVTGRRPFQGDSDYAIMAAHLEKQPLPPIELNSKLPPALNDIILMALAKNPSQRFQSADAFRTALESVKGNLGQAVVASAPARPQDSMPTADLKVAPQAVPSPTPGSESSAPPPQTAQARSHRALYMGLGAVLTIIVIFLAAMEAPKHFTTRAVGSAPSTRPAVPGQANTPSAAPQSPGALPPILSPGSESAPKQTPPSSPQPTPPSEGMASQSHGGVRADSQRQATKTSVPPVGTQVQPRGNPPLKPSGAKGQSASTSPPSSTTPPPVGDSANSESLQELKDRMVLLASRANAARDSVDNLRRQQNSAELSLRHDIAASLSRMEQFMDRADASLSAGDPKSAKRDMDLGEHEIEKLERFLEGR